MLGSERGWLLTATSCVALVAVAQHQTVVRVLDDGGGAVVGADVLVFDVERELRAPRGPLAYIEDSSSAVVRAETDAEGLASLAVPRAGRYRAWAGKRGWTWVPGAEFEVDGSARTLELTLAIEPLDAANELAGTVLRPSGVPVARAVVSFHTLEDGELQVRSALTDADGGFAIPSLHPRQAGALLVRTYKDTLGSVVLEPVVAGQPQLVVHMRPRQRFELDVRDAAGEPVVKYDASFERLILGRWVPEEASALPRPDPPVVWGVPSVPFRVNVRAEGFADAQLGPLEPEGIAAVLRVELTPLPRARGRVTRDGAPVAGARVWLASRTSHAPEALASVFARQAKSSDGTRAVTDADGRFELVLRRAGTFDLIAHAEPDGAGRSSELVLDVTRDVDGLELELTRGGAIHGRLRAPAGHRPSEALVLFENEHEWFFTGVDDDGRFFVEGLSAGPWSLALRERGEREEPFDAHLGRRIRPFHGTCEGPAPWERIDTARFVELEAGASLELDWDAARAPACVLAGSARFDGRALELVPHSEYGMFGPLDRHAYLEREGDAAPRARAPIADDGSFTLAVDEPGVYRLRLVLPLAKGSQLLVLDEIELAPGARSWSLDVPTGSLALRAAGTPKVERLRFVHRWRGDGELRVFARFPREHASPGWLEFPRVPAGAGHLAFDVHGEPLEILAEIEVPIGGEARVELER